MEHIAVVSSCLCQAPIQRCLLHALEPRPQNPSKSHSKLTLQVQRWQRVPQGLFGQEKSGCHGISKWKVGNVGVAQLSCSFFPSVFTANFLPVPDVAMSKTNRGQLLNFWILFWLSVPQLLVLPAVMGCWCCLWCCFCCCCCSCCNFSWSTSAFTGKGH